MVYCYYLYFPTFFLWACDQAFLLFSNGKCILNSKDYLLKIISMKRWHIICLSVPRCHNLCSGLHIISDRMLSFYIAKWHFYCAYIEHFFICLSDDENLKFCILFGCITGKSETISVYLVEWHSFLFDMCIAVKLLYYMRVPF